MNATLDALARRYITARYEAEFRALHENDDKTSLYAAVDTAVYVWEELSDLCEELGFPYGETETEIGDQTVIEVWCDETKGETNG